MKHIGIWTNTLRDTDLSVTDRLVREILSRGAKVRLPSDLAERIAMPQLGCEKEELFCDSDGVVVLGGDGTLLYAARKAAIHGVPVLGLNLGRLGFLSEAEVPGIPEMVEALIHDRYQIEPRMMLEVTLPDMGRSELAFNDVVLSRGSLLHIVQVELYINDEFADRFAADGVLVATPTGATGYSLSVGGPIISPNLACMVISPISAHTLRTRPVVLSDQEKVRFRILIREESSERVMVTLDGQRSIEVPSGQWVEVCKASYMVRLIRMREQNFYRLLQLKFSEWNEGARA